MQAPAHLGLWRARRAWGSPLSGGASQNPSRPGRPLCGGIAPQEAGGPFALKVKGYNEVVLEDVLVGDVWLCTGQSNMEYQVGGFG